MIVRQLHLGPMDNLSYIVADESTKECILIDAAWDKELLKTEILKLGCELNSIVLTHGHFDHSNAVKFFLSENENLYVLLHKSDDFMVDKEISSAEIAIPYRKKFIKDNQFISVGNHKMKVLHTPGHTPGSCSFLIENYLFTGDTLFIQGCGRVDLPGSNPHDLWKSFLKFHELPDETIVYPGHSYNGFSSTIGEEKKNNPYMKLSLESREEFIKAVT